MRTSEIIDNGLSLGDNVSESDSAYVERRRRALVGLVEVFFAAYTARPWARRKTSARLIVPAGAGKVAVPWDYARVGTYGAAYLVQGGIVSSHPLDEVSEDQITSIRAAGDPHAYSIFDVEQVGVDGFRDLFQIGPNAAAVEVELHYCRKAPRLVDAKDPDAGATQAVTLALAGTTVTATTLQPHGFTTDDFVAVTDATAADYEGSFRITVIGPLTFTYEIATAPATPDAGNVAIDVTRGDVATNHIPEDFHIPLLCNGLKAALRESKGDARWQKLDTDYQAALAAVKRERGRFSSGLHQIPGFFGR